MRCVHVTCCYVVPLCRPVNRGIVLNIKLLKKQRFTFCSHCINTSYLLVNLNLCQTGIKHKFKLNVLIENNSVTDVNNAESWVWRPLVGMKRHLSEGQDQGVFLCDHPDGVAVAHGEVNLATVAPQLRGVGWHPRGKQPRKDKHVTFLSQDNIRKQSG